MSLAPSMMMTRSSGECVASNVGSTRAPLRSAVGQWSSKAVVRPFSPSAMTRDFAAERCLQHARPAVFERMPARVFGAVAPGQGVAVAKDRLHAALLMPARRRARSAASCTARAPTRQRTISHCTTMIATPGRIEPGDDRQIACRSRGAPATAANVQPRPARRARRRRRSASRNRRRVGRIGPHCRRTARRRRRTVTIATTSTTVSMKTQDAIPRCAPRPHGQRLRNQPAGNSRQEECEQRW